MNYATRADCLVAGAGVPKPAGACCLGLPDISCTSFEVFQVVYSSLPDWVMPAVSVVLELKPYTRLAGGITAITFR